jgi:hypothetical protein
MTFKFEKLNIWQKAMDFGEEIFLLSKNFPKTEIYNLNIKSWRFNSFKYLGGFNFTIK